MTDGSDWKRLGETILKRRESLRLTQADVQARGGPSLKTQSLVERGVVESIKRQTKSAYEHALGWTRGSVDDVLAGGHPTLAGSASATSRVEVLHEEPGERILVSIVDGVAELSDEDRRHILALIRSMQAQKKQHPDSRT